MADQLLTRSLSMDEQRELGLGLALAPDGPDLTELNGFFCGVLTLPRPIPPRQWLTHPLLPTSDKTLEETDRLVNLLFRFHNQVADRMLADSAAPLADDSPQQTEHWMTGFARGTAADPWAVSQINTSERGSALAMLLLSYTVGTSALPDSMLASMPQDARQELQDARDHSRRAFEERAPEETLSMLRSMATIMTVISESERRRPEHVPRRAGRKVGPNEASPCGSGLRYERCCGRP